MGVLDRLRELQVQATPQQVEPRAHDLAAADLATCKKAGMLAAYGLHDRAIADALLLSGEQIQAIKQTEEFKLAYSSGAQERAQRAIDLEEGWDLVETKALTTVLETLQHNRDPRFALNAAFTANRAQRRSPAGNGRVIDASRAGNVIVLQLNTNFVQNKEENDGHRTIDVTPERRGQLLRKHHDVPTPKKVAGLLGVTDRKNVSNTDEIMEICRANGITVDLIDED